MIGVKIRRYIDFVILVCCLIVAFNIHPTNTTDDKNITTEKHTMTYIFHDYKGNEYKMNDNLHGSSSSWDYLFEEDVPSEVKGEKEFTDSVSLGDLISNDPEYNDKEGSDNEGNSSNSVKNNQVSLSDIMSELGVDFQNTNDSNSSYVEDNNTLVISIGNNKEKQNNNEDNYYTVEDTGSGDNSSLIIERIDGNLDETKNNEGDNKTKTTKNNIGSNKTTAKYFTFVEEGLVLPILVSRDDLFSNNGQSIAYLNNGSNYVNNELVKKSGITIIEDYADCMTPWGYKIAHGDSVLAYQQMSDTPDICNIERRFCWKGKLSGKYTQQGCYVNNNYTYEQWGDVKVQTETQSKNNKGFKGGTRQNSNGSVSVKNSEIGGSFVFDKPNNIYSDFNESDNIRTESQGIEQTSRSYPDCTTPRGEKVKHGQFIQAFKHANGFSDAPCEAQIRLCSMGKLQGTYTESTCKTRDTSFIDRVNGSPTWQTYSKEKLELIKKQIKAEEVYYENTRNSERRSTNSDALDRILYILDED